MLTFKHLVRCQLIAVVVAISVLQNSWAQTVQATKTRHVSLFTSDNEKLARWYVEKLGLAHDARFTIQRPDGTVIDIIRLKLGDMLLHISKLDKLTPKARQLEYEGWRHIAFVVDDVDKAWASLKSSGADAVGSGGIDFVPRGAALSAYRVSFVRDPDGNFIELYQDRAK
jgi:catechol 2,3-dioxygenase-like lactoylglutathione lyase family enzyme